MAAEKVVVEGSDVPVLQLADLYRQIGDGSLNGLEIRALVRGKKPPHLSSPFTTDDMENLAKGIRLRRITKDVVQECIEHHCPFGLGSIQFDWREIYGLVGIEIWRFEQYFEPSAADVWELYVLPGISMANLVGAIRKTGVNIQHQYDGESEQYAEYRAERRHDRDPYFNGAYRVSFPRCHSSDVKLKGMPYDKYVADKLLGITIYEKLLLELGYILTTGRVMEAKTCCLCPGTDVPGTGGENPYLGHVVQSSYQVDYGISSLGRAWDANYGPGNIRTHLAIPGSFRGLR